MRIAVLGLSLALLGAAAAAEEEKPADRPVEKQLEILKQQFLKTAPPERVKVYERGIEQVRISGVLERARKVGDKAPDFELPNAYGKKVRLSELLKQGPVVVTWYRGGWCPYCHIGLSGFQKAMPQIQEQGATVVAVSPQKPEFARESAQKNKLELQLLSDEGNKVARAYGVIYKLPDEVAEAFKGRLDLAKYNGDDSNELPLAATYVIDRDGTIRYAFLDADYRKRAEPADVVAALKKLKAPAATGR